MAAALEGVSLSGSSVGETGFDSEEYDAPVPPVRRLPALRASAHRLHALRATAHRSRRGPWIAIGGAGLAVAAAAGTVIALHPFAKPSTTLHDATGDVTVTVPDGWQRQVNPDGFALTRLGASGRAAGLGAAPDLAKWQDPSSSTPGVLVGVSPALAATSTDRLLGAVPHPGCTEAGGRKGSFDSSQWTSRTWSCHGVTFDTAVMRTSGSQQVIYVQVKESTNDDYLLGILGSIKTK